MKKGLPIKKNTEIKKDTDNNTTEGCQKFLQIMTENYEDVSKVLKGHLLAELFLDKIIKAKMKRGDIIISSGKFLFADKLIIVKGLDVLDENTIISLQHLNKLRNKFSHEFDYKILQKDIDSIGIPFGESFSKVKSKYNNQKDILDQIIMFIVVRLEIRYESVLKSNK